MSLPDSTPGGRPPPTVDRVSWRRGAGTAMPAVAGVLILAVGILTGRVEIAGLALPMLLGLAWAARLRPAPTGRNGGGGETSGSGETGPAISAVELETGDQSNTGGRIRGLLRWTPAARTEQLRVNVSSPGHQPIQLVLGPGPAADRSRAVGVSMRSVRTGRRPVFAVDQVETCAGQLQARLPQQVGPIAVTVLPSAKPLRELPLPPRLQGLTGPHTSARPGDGGDLRDINLFTPGDRLRRIDWRVTARHAGPARLTELYVRRTFATADATVMLVLDSRDEVGPDVRTWGDVTTVREDEATSLDHSRDAAATVARAYLEAGDRVGLEDLGRLRRPIPPAGGRRQLERLRQRIAISEPEGDPKQRRRVPRLAQEWRRSGHRVIAVDVLPPVRLDELDPRQLVAYRIVAMERADRLGELRRSDVEVVRWLTDPADPDTPPMLVALTTLARRRVRR